MKMITWTTEYFEITLTNRKKFKKRKFEIHHFFHFFHFFSLFSLFQRYFQHFVYLVNYAKSIREENRKLKRELRRSSHDIPKPNKPSWTDKSSPPYSSYQPEKASEKPNSDYQVVLSRKNSIVDLKSETLTKTSPSNVDIEKIVQMEVDAAVGQMHVAMQRDMSKLRARYRTKLHQERQKSKK